MWTSLKWLGIAVVLSTVLGGLWWLHKALCEGEAARGAVDQIVKERAENARLRDDLATMTGSFEEASKRFLDLRKSDPGCEPFRALKLPRCELERR